VFHIYLIAPITLVLTQLTNASSVCSPQFPYLTRILCDHRTAPRLRSPVFGAAPLSTNSLTSYDELPKLCAGHFCLFFAEGRQRQHNFRKGPQVVTMIGGGLDLLDTCILVAVDSSEAENPLFAPGKLL
jgi:hypothetical protein